MLSGYRGQLASKTCYVINVYTLLAVIGLLGIGWIIQRTFKIMAAIDDLNAEIVAIGTSVSNAIAAETAAITAASANNDSAAIETAVGNLKTVQATLDAFTASITPPAPPASPAA